MSAMHVDNRTRRSAFEAGEEKDNSGRSHKTIIIPFFSFQVHSASTARLSLARQPYE